VADNDAAPTVTLTPREREVLELAAVGLTAKEIAGELDIAARTVEHHLDRACVRLNAGNVPNAVAKGIVLGLIRP
jgi:DNA-binding CsgD family transcriptional regulator